MSSPARELELKFALSGEQFERLLVGIKLLPQAIAPPVTRQEKSVYYDTPDLRLGDHGLALRLRASSGEWLQTVKLKSGVRGGVSHPVQIECMLTEQQPDIARISDDRVAHRLRKAIGKRQLGPVFETIVERTVVDFLMPDGSIAELSLDRGQVKAGDRSEPICEAEVELKKGRPDALIAAADLLFGGDFPPFGQRSKSQSGYNLLAPEKSPSQKPRKAKTPSLDARMTCTTALGLILEETAAQVLDNWEQLDANDDPEIIHQMRVGIRRLRSAIRIFEPVLPPSLAEPIVDKLRELARMIGVVRQLDVLEEDVVGPLQKSHGKAKPLAALRKVLRELAKRQRVDLHNELRERQQAHFKRELALFPAMATHALSGEEHTAAAVPISDFAAIAIDSCWKKVSKNGRILSTLDDTGRHGLRKDLKTLRYALEFFEAIYAVRKFRRFSQRLEKLLDLFGYMNDVVESKALATLVSEHDADIQHVAGLVVGWHMARADEALGDARKAWKKLKETDRFWK